MEDYMLVAVINIYSYDTFVFHLFFLFLGYDGNSFLRSCEVYNPNKDSWETVAPMNVKRSRVALAANMGKLWAIGGYDGESNLSSCEVYDPL